MHDRLTENVAIVVNVWLNSRFVTTQKRFAMNKGAEQSRNVRAKKSADDDVSGGKVTAAVDWERERGREAWKRPTPDDNFPEIRMSALKVRAHSALDQ